MKKCKKKTLGYVTVLGICILLLGSTTGLTLAWLRDEGEPVKTTFVAGDIKISLSETTNTEFSILPGIVAGKVPTVTVLPHSEPCYLFIKAIEDNNTFDGLEGPVIYWDVRENPTEWIPVDGYEYLWYRKVTAADAAAGKSYQILEGNNAYPDGYIYVNPDVLRTMTDEINRNKPTLEFMAAAVQSENVPTLDAALQAIPDGFINP